MSRIGLVIVVAVFAGVTFGFGRWSGDLPEKQITDAQQRGFDLAFDVAMGVTYYCGARFHTAPERYDETKNYWSCWERREVGPLFKATSNPHEAD